MQNSTVVINQQKKTIFQQIYSKIQNSFMIIKQDRFFKYTALGIAMKTLLFFLLISDDKANGVNFKSLFFTVPPILIYASFICLFLSFAYVFKGKMHLWSYTVLNMFVTLLYVGDILYYRSNHSFLNYHMLSFTSNMDNLGGSILAMFRPVDALFLIDLIIIIILSVKKQSSYTGVKRNLTSFCILFFLPIIYLTYAHYKVDVYKKSYENQYLFRKVWSQNQTMTNLTPIGYHIYDLYDFYKESQPYKLSDAEKKETNEFFKNKYENLPDNQYSGLFKGKNLLIIQVESLENNVIGNKLNGVEITPNLNRLLKNSFYFNNFHEQTHNGTTSDAELITNTSVFPVRSGATFFRYPSNTYQSSLPNLFRDMGYSSLASHPDKGSYWNWMQALRAIGYEKLLDSSNYNIDEIINLGASDATYLKQFKDEVIKLPQPFLAYTVTLSNHTPFTLPEKDKELKLPSDLENTMVGKSLQTANYTDKHIGLMLDALDKEGILDNTIVAIYGDHEGVNKFFGDEVAKTKGEPWFQGNDRRVPLIIYSKGMNGQVIDKIGGQADTLPTLAYLFGIPKEKYALSSFGRNLLNTNKDYVVLSTRKVISKNINKEEEQLLLDSIDLSDKLIRANYFKKE